MPDEIFQNIEKIRQTAQSSAAASSDSTSYYTILNVFKIEISSSKSAEKNMFVILKRKVSRDFWPPLISWFWPIWARYSYAEVFSQTVSNSWRYSLMQKKHTSFWFEHFPKSNPKTGGGAVNIWWHFPFKTIYLNNFSVFSNENWYQLNKSNYTHIFLLKVGQMKSEITGSDPDLN